MAKPGYMLIRGDANRIPLRDRSVHCVVTSPPETELAYLAGCVDSDGCIGVKKSTYQIRVTKEAKNPTYIERVSLKQVTDIVPNMLKSTFGGMVRWCKPNSPNSRPMWLWQATNRQAVRCCEVLLPYLRIKRRQAECCLEIRETKDGKYRQHSYWFLKENPDWRSGELITATEVRIALGYSGTDLVHQAYRQGALLALPGVRGSVTPRFARGLVERLSAVATRESGSLKYGTPQELVSWRERLWSEVRELNKVGVNGTPLYYRTGPYKTAEIPA